MGEYLGTVISRRSVALNAPTTGRVTAIHARPGQQVAAGKVLVEVEPAEEQATLQAARAGLARARTQLRNAQRIRKRNELLRRDGIISAQDYETSLAQERSARAQVAEAHAAVRARQARLALTRVVAPFAGVVGDVPVKLGDSVSPQTLITSVDDHRALEVSVGIPLERLDEVEAGRTPVELLEPEGRLLQRAAIFFIAPRPDPDTQLVQVKAAFRNDSGLRQGQLVRARVVYAVRQALAVPTFAVTRQSGQAFVFAVLEAEGGGERVERRPVTLGPLQDGHYVVERGLEAGQRIAVSQLQALQDGQGVQTLAPGVGGSGREGSDGGQPR